MENITVIYAAGHSINKVLYTGKVNIAGGREGFAKSSDGNLDIKLTPPGSNMPGTNPEQLFAAGWSACFIGAMRHNAATLKLAIPDNTTVDAEVDLATGDGGFFLQARLTVHLPGVELELAKEIITAAHQTCPYSKLSRGSINVRIDVKV